MQKTDEKQRVKLFARVDPDVKTKLLQKATQEKTSLAKLLDRILRSFLEADHGSERIADGEASKESRQGNGKRNS
tara:strand:+ start:152 stop:376 length:225 start_codon:yes stop_codon:yes gene_type:complete